MVIAHHGSIFDHEDAHNQFVDIRSEFDVDGLADMDLIAQAAVEDNSR